MWAMGPFLTGSTTDVVVVVSSVDAAGGVVFFSPSPLEQLATVNASIITARMSAIIFFIYTPFLFV